MERELGALSGDGDRRTTDNRTWNLFRSGIWQNDANSRALAEGAFGFDPAAVELSDVFDDG